MHVLGIILAIAAGIAIWVIRVNMAANAAKNLGATARDAHSFWRRMKWKAKHDRHPLDGLEDPRDAAAVLLFLTARMGGEMTATQKARILHEIQGHFGEDEEAAATRLNHAAWLARDLEPENLRLARLLSPIEETCSAKEKEELVIMMQGVAACDGLLGPDQNAFINRVTEALKPQKH